MTHLPHQDVREGLQAVVAVDAVLALATGGVAEFIGDNPTYPLVRIAVRGTPVGAMASTAIWELEAEIDIYSAYQGGAEALAIADLIIGLLNHQTIVVNGWTVILSAVLDVVPIDGELIADEPVGRWMIPVLLHVERAA